MKYLAFFFSLALLSVVACTSLEDDLVTEEQSAETHVSTRAGNSLCVLTSPTTPNPSCNPIVNTNPATPNVDVNQNPNGSCVVEVFIPAGTGPGEYCIVYSNGGGCVAGTYVAPGTGTSGGTATFIEVIDNGPFVITIESRGLGGCYSDLFFC